MRPPASASGTPKAAAAARREPRRRERVKAQDLSAAQVRSWLDDACFDVVESDCDTDISARVDDTRLHIRTLHRSGELLLMADFQLGDEADDREQLLEAVNAANRSALFVRCVLRGSVDEPYLRVEHEHFSCDGHVSRRQLVKLVRRFALCARRAQSSVIDDL
jgi:hypothetical protein